MMRVILMAFLFTRALTMNSVADDKKDPPEKVDPKFPEKVSVRNC